MQQQPWEIVQGQMNAIYKLGYEAAKSYVKECPNCQGEGYVTVANGEDDFDKEECGECLGEGLVDTFEDYTTSEGEEA